MSDFDDAVKELRALGIEIVQGQGEYHLFYRSRGRRDQGIALTDLAEAIAKGHDMAEHRPASLPPMGPTGRRNTRRGKMILQNRKIAARRRRLAKLQPVTP